MGLTDRRHDGCTCVHADVGPCEQHAFAVDDRVTLPDNHPQAARGNVAIVTGLLVGGWVVEVKIGDTDTFAYCYDLTSSPRCETCGVPSGCSHMQACRP